MKKPPIAPSTPAIIERLVSKEFNKMPITALRHFSLADVERLTPVVLTYCRDKHIAVILSYRDFVDLMSLLKIEVVP